MLPAAVARSSIAALWHTSVFVMFHIMGQYIIWRVALEIMDVGAVLPEVVRNFQRIRQGALRCLTMPWQYAAAAY